MRIRSHGLTRNAISEIIRAVVLSRADQATDLLRANIDPPAEARLAEGLDLSRLSIDALDVFKLAVAGVTFSKERLGATLAEAARWSKVNELGEVDRGSRRHRLEQLGDRRQPHRERPADPRQ